MNGEQDEFRFSDLFYYTSTVAADYMLRLYMQTISYT